MLTWVELVLAALMDCLFMLRGQSWGPAVTVAVLSLAIWGQLAREVLMNRGRLWAAAVTVAALSLAILALLAQALQAFDAPQFRAKDLRRPNLRT